MSSASLHCFLSITGTAGGLCFVILRLNEGGSSSQQGGVKQGESNAGGHCMKAVCPPPPFHQDQSMKMHSLNDQTVFFKWVKRFCFSQELHETSVSSFEVGLLQPPELQVKESNTTFYLTFCAYLERLKQCFSLHVDTSNTAGQSSGSQWN